MYVHTYIHGDVIVLTVLTIYRTVMSKTLISCSKENHVPPHSLMPM